MLLWVSVAGRVVPLGGVEGEGVLLWVSAAVLVVPRGGVEGREAGGSVMGRDLLQ